MFISGCWVVPNLRLMKDPMVKKQIYFVIPYIEEVDRCYLSACARE